MIIIAGYELVDVQERDKYVAAHRDLVSRAREFDGCIHVAITADSVDPERINSVGPRSRPAGEARGFPARLRVRQQGATAA